MADLEEALGDAEPRTSHRHGARARGARTTRTAIVAILIAGPAALSCDSSSSSPATTPGACASPASAVIAASDYTSSELSVLTQAATITPPITGLDLGADPVLSVSGGRCFYVSRDLDLLVELDPTCGTPLRKIEVGLSPPPVKDNPQDVAATADGTLFIPKFRTGDLVVRTPSGDLSAIHLASFDPDGNPNPSSATTVTVGGTEKIFVTLERLDANLKPGVIPSLVVRVDPATRAVDGQVTLVGRDPFGLAVPFGGALYLAEPGLFSDVTETNAGIERVDPATMTSALIVVEKDLGGSVAEVAVTRGCGAAIIADPTSANATSLVTFDPIAGTIHTSLAASPLKTSGYDLEGLAFIADTLYVGDRRRAAGGYPMHAFAVSPDCTLTAQPDVLFLTQAPVAIRQPQ